MKPHIPAGPVLACLLAAGLAGCIHLPRDLAQLIKVKPASVDLGVPQSADDRLYADAVRAIDKRDYGDAISLLQLARESKPRDPRVLTAMGVVYDKLGRFDLSDRYYDLAEKADPGSRIVALDRRYSMFLRTSGREARDLPGGVALAQGPAIDAAATPVASKAADSIYADAVQAIQKHEYGRAVGLLRQARESQPGDARVLAALGVTYDHLGRFDLSSRYYDEAEKADPGSTVVAQDRRTSLMLQQHGGSAGPDDIVVLAAAGESVQHVAKVTPAGRRHGA